MAARHPATRNKRRFSLLGCGSHSAFRRATENTSITVYLHKNAS